MPHKTLKDLYLEAGLNFSGDGIRNLITAPTKHHQAAWVLFILLSTSLCICYITLSLIDFFAYDVITSVRVRNLQELLMPALIVCSWGSEYPIDQAVFICRFDEEDCQLFDRPHRVLVLGKGTSSNRYCVRFNGIVRASKPTRYMRVTNIGIEEYGLMLILLLPENNTSVLYRIYENTDLIRSDEITASPLRGYANFISVRKTVRDRLSNPYNQCMEDVSQLRNKLTDEISLMGSKYRQDFCYRLCLLHSIEDECRCELPKQLGLNGTDNCGHGCIEAVKNSFDFETKCGRECPLECDSVEYELKVNSERINTSVLRDNILWKLRQGLNVTVISAEQEREFFGRMVGFKVNFESLSVTEVTELPKVTVGNLVADLGGTFGKIF